MNRLLRYFLVNFGNTKLVKSCVPLLKPSLYLYQLELHRFGSLQMKFLLPLPLVFLEISLVLLSVSWFQPILSLDPLLKPMKLTIFIQVIFTFFLTNIFDYVFYVKIRHYPVLTGSETIFRWVTRFQGCPQSTYHWTFASIHYWICCFCPCLLHF